MNNNNNKRMAVLGTVAAMVLLTGCGASTTLPDVEQMVYDAEYELAWGVADSMWSDTPRHEKEDICLGWFLAPDAAMDAGDFPHPAHEDAVADHFNSVCDWGAVR